MTTLRWHFARVMCLAIVLSAIASARDARAQDIMVVGTVPIATSGGAGVSFTF